MAAFKLPVLGFLCLLLLVTPSSGRNEYTDRKYYRTAFGFLLQVPDDIPFDALEVYLQRNHLFEIQSNAFVTLRQCLILDLSSNFIRTINTDAFNGLVSLKVLNLNDNSLSTPKSHWFKELVTLEELYLNKAGIKGVGNINAAMFTDLVKLRILDLDENKSTYTSFSLRSNTFSSLTSLEDLRLSQDYISAIEGGTFAGLSKLKYLTLSRNLIESLPTQAFLGLESIITIKLQGNKLTSLDQAVFGILPRPLGIQIYANRLRCDTSMCWMKYENEAGSIMWLNDVSPECDVTGESPNQLWENVQWDCASVDIPKTPRLRNITIPTSSDPGQDSGQNTGQESGRGIFGWDGYDSSDSNIAAQAKIKKESSRPPPSSTTSEGREVEVGLASQQGGSNESAPDHPTEGRVGPTGHQHPIGRSNRTNTAIE